MQPLPVYILAGGRSSRFGSDKARARLAGQPLIVRLAHSLHPIASRLTVVADQFDKYEDLGLATIMDRYPGWLGPLAGLHTALEHCRKYETSEWVLLAACDLVEVKVDWVEALAAHAGGEAQAVLFRGERWEPLFALYHTSLLATVQEHLCRGTRAMRRLIEEVRHVAVPLPADWPMISQINSPEDWRAHEELMGGSQRQPASSQPS
jgi:molybdopterin-guanine dinucleotide biosynthesis protein A